MLERGLTCLNRAGDHRDDRHKQTADDVKEGPEETDFDWSRQVGLCPAENGQTEHGHANTQLE